MRKLALLAVVLVPLVSGCVSRTCDIPTVSIDWRLQDPDGIPWGCFAASVAYVDIYIGTAQPIRYNCSSGGADIDVSGFAPGSYPVTVEGVDVDGVIIDRALFNVRVGDCGGSLYSAVLAEGRLEIDYHFAPVDACHGGYMWFALQDDTTDQDISIVDAATPVAPPDYTVWQNYYGCYSSPTSGTPLRFPVPYGPYTLRGIQEVVNPLTTPVSAYEMCTPSSFTIGAPGITLFTPPALLQTLSGAPACF
jgi:hypothetical protein